MNLPDHYRNTDLAVRNPASTLPGLPAGRDESDRLDIRMLFSIFRRRLTLFGAIVGICVGLALIFTSSQPRLYEATADVVMNKRGGELVPDAGSTRTDTPIRSEEIDTEIKIIRSQETAREVIATAGLERDPAFVNWATNRGGLVSSLKRLVGMGPPPPPAKDASRALVGALLANVRAERMETAYAIRISFRGPDPRQVANIANAFAQAYSNSAVTAKRNENEKTLAQLKTRIDELRGEAQADFSAVQDFRVRNNLLSAQATQLSEQEASAYGQQLAQARAAASADAGRAAAARGAGMAAAVNSPVIQSLRSQRSVISVKVADLSGRYLDGHPDLVLARRQLADIDSQIEAEIARVNAGVSAGLAASAQATGQQAGSLAGNLAAARGTLAANNRALVGLDDLSRKAQASQALYESYLTRYKEVLAGSGTERAEARLLSAASVPGSPVTPNLMLNLALGLVLGVLIGAAAAIAVESAFSGLTTGEDVESRLRVRYLGGIPLLASVDIDSTSPPESLVELPGSAFAESIRGMLSASRQAGTGRQQVIAVTSALPGEGKTSLSASIARAAALAGETVIVIDCDLVRPGLSEMFGAVPGVPGLRELMRDGIKLGDAMMKDPLSDAMILPITTQFTNGERLLERGNFHRMIAMLREHFSLIILDTAPILPIAETREIVSLADNVIVSVLWRKTPDTAVRAALRMLPMNAISDIGAVLNCIDMRKQSRFGAGDASSYYHNYKKYYVAA